jgi:hypothetical protein
MEPVMTLRTETKRADPLSHESYRRDPGPVFSDEARAEQIAAFLNSGGKIQSIPFGVTTISGPIPLRQSKKVSDE